MEPINSYLDSLSSDIFTDICFYLYGEDLIRVSEMNPEFIKTLSDSYFLKKKSFHDFNKKIGTWDEYIQYTSNKHVTRYSLNNNILKKASMIHDKQLINFLINEMNNLWKVGCHVNIPFIIMSGLLGAARGGHLDIVKLMLEKGADNKYNWAMLNAANGGHIDIVKFILEKGANNYNHTMVCAANGGHIDIVKLMLEKGANHYNKAMENAANGGHIDIINLMLEKGAYSYNSAMVCAARRGYLDIVKLMLEKGANNYDEAKKTAAKHGHIDIVNLLLSKINN